MRQDQTKYAMARVDNLAAARLRVLEAAYAPKYLTWAQQKAIILDALTEPRLLTLLPSTQQYTDIREAFDWTPFQPAVDTAEFDRKKAALQAERERVKDNIMLGDSEQALKLLEAFAQWTA
jgi:hypothetical protein